MGADQQTDWRDAIASALSWWDEAGVDTLVDDAPRDWLAPVVPLRIAPLPPGAPGVPSTPATLAPPDTLAAFLSWRQGEDQPEAGWPSAWIETDGPVDAGLMVLVDCPDRDDDCTLMAGESGRLFEAMLAAIGLTRAQVHLAAVCGKRPTAGRVPPEAVARLEALAQHHVALVAPKHLLLLGDAASRAILTTGVVEARGRLHRFNHRSGETGVVASFHPRLLLEQPVRKAKAWADLLALRKGIGE